MNLYIALDVILTIPDPLILVKREKRKKSRKTEESQW